MFSYVIPDGALNGGDICRIMAFQIDDRFGYAGFVRVREYELLDTCHDSRLIDVLFDCGDEGLRAAAVLLG